MKSELALAKKRDGGQGATEEEPAELQAARRIALAAVDEAVQAILDVLRNPGVRGSQFRILAAKEILALAQGVRQTNTVVAQNIIMMVEPRAMRNEMKRRLFDAEHVDATQDR